ncbi:MAG: methionyl-tRNA formyltransferase [Chitinophagaceae bacterium]
MGTPEFAVASLDALINAGYNIVGVITAPDKPGGRGMQLRHSEVKKYAVEHNLKILQPEKLKNPEFLSVLKTLNADLQIVVAFRMLPEVVWNMPRMGTVNLHGSILPQYRGAAPINWAVINGEKETGVTTFKLKQEIDTGDILLQEKFPIGENETAGEVHDRMKEIGAQVLVKTVKGLADGTLKEVSQENIQSSMLNVQGSILSDGDRQALKHAPKIFTETCRIDFKKTVEEVHNLIRGLSPFPGAFTELNGKMLKIYRSEKEASPELRSFPSPPGGGSGTSGRGDSGKTGADRPDQNSGQTETLRPGEYKTDGKTFLKLACSNGYIYVKELQLEGKKKMFVEEFLRGYHFK